MSRTGTATSGCASAPSSQRSGANEEGEAAQLPSARRAFLQAVQQELTVRIGGQSRAALILLEVDANYLRRSARPIPELLQEWHNSGTLKIRCARVEEMRYAVFVAQIGFDAQARRLAEHLTHALDPRVCPLLRRALPYAYWGVGVCPGDGSAADVLLAAAERDLEQRRRTRSRYVRMQRPRRRALTPAPLGSLLAVR